MKKSNQVKKALVGKHIVQIAAAVTLAVTMLPAAAFASTATSNIALKVDDASLSVTAPVTISYAMAADGTFVAPDAASAKIVNKSVVPVSVKSYTVAPLAGTKAVAKSAFAASVDKNAWWLEVKPNSGAAKPFNLSQATLDSTWNMALAGSAGAEIALSTEGAMKNIDATIDFSAAKNISTVTWTFGAVKNA